MRLGLVLSAVCMCVLVAATPPTAVGAKRKAPSCRGTKVPVTVGKEKTCQPLAKVFPKPKAIDIRLAYLEQALRFDPAKTVPTKRRKRVRTLQSGFGAAGKRAQKKLLKLAPKLLAFIDRKGGARSSSFGPGPALASAGCEPGPAGPTGHTDGASIGTLGENGGYVDAPIGGGLRVKVTFVSCGGVTYFNLPDCPTANGGVDGKGSGEFRATFEVRDGDRVVSRNSSVFEEKSKIHGEVGPDAKLKSIEVEHTQEVFIVATGGIVIRGGVTRKVLMQMPGGGYDPAHASARFFGDPLEPGAGADSFASTAKGAIQAYSSVEPGWSSFKEPYCAEPVFSPAANTIKLKRGDRNTLGIYAKAKDGGPATAARWTLLSPLNAEFTPSSSEAASPSISYTVSGSPQGDEVRVTAKFTSTAGVGQKTWTQPIESGEAINHIDGTFGGFHETMGGTLQTWSGSLSFERIGPAPAFGALGIYEMQSGSASLTVSGETRRGEPEYTCQVDGQMSFSELGKLGSILVRVQSDESAQLPYEYSLEVFLPGTVPPEEGPLEDKVTIEFSNCGEKSDELDGTTDEIPAAWDLVLFENQPSDGVTFAGSIEEVVGSVTREKHWSLHGSP